MAKPAKRLGLTTWILIALVAGALMGIILNPWNQVPWIKSFLLDGAFYLGGQVFFNLLKLLVVPVVFVSLVCGVSVLEDIGKFGRIGGKTIAYYLFTTAAAITLAMSVALLVRPGDGFQLSTNLEFQTKEAPSLVKTLLDIIPSNPIQSMADANMLQVIVLALLIGLSIVMSGAKGKVVASGFQAFNEVLMKLVGIVMSFAPIGVFCLIARVLSEQGFAAFAPLSLYFFTVLGVLLIHGLLVYGGLFRIFAGLSPFQAFKKLRGLWIFAFSTSSSNATLPVTIRTAEEKLGVHPSVASFTLPLGATINMDGTAIMQGVATVFIAQAYGIEIGLTGYLMVILTATLASIGTAGVPGVGLVTLAMVLKQVNLPVEGIALIIGVDRLLDMARTVVNITGDVTVSCIVARQEKQFSLPIFQKAVDS